MVKRYKKESEMSYALGATVTMELLKKHPEAATEIFVSPKSDIIEVVECATSKGITVTESNKPFNILSPKENCFVIGEFKKFTAPIRSARHHIVLVNPSNSGNLGTIMRAVAAFDCMDLVIIRPAADPFDPKTVRASMGAIFDIRLSVYDSFEDYIKHFPGREIVPFMLDGSPFSKKKFESGKKYSLCFGNEASGLPQSFSGFGAVKIEQSDNVDSLNLSVAVAIAAYRMYVSKV